MTSVILAIFTLICIGGSVYAFVQTIRIRRKIFRFLTSPAAIESSKNSSEGASSSSSIRLDQSCLGKFEGSLENLEMVIVVADQIQRPTNSMLDSVRKNLQNGVRYLFLVSNSKAPLELSRYYSFFETEARIAKQDFNLPLSVSEMVCIQQLPYEWENYPFIFYRQRVRIDGTDDSMLRTVAVRGNLRQSGIAEYYDAVPSEYAEAIARTILSQAPTPLQEAVAIEKDNFADVSDVQVFPPERVATGRVN